jgi:hypothetical protein
MASFILYRKSINPNCQYSKPKNKTQKKTATQVPQGDGYKQSYGFFLPLPATSTSNLSRCLCTLPNQTYHELVEVNA